MNYRVSFGDYCVLWEMCYMRKLLDDTASYDRYIRGRFYMLMEEVENSTHPNSPLVRFCMKLKDAEESLRRYALLQEALDV